MSTDGGRAEAGWYEDPHEPGRLRYFDGEVWTNHFHTDGELPDIASWFGTTFSVFGRHWPGAAVIAFITALISTAVFWFGAREVLDEVAVIDQEIVNLTSADAFGLGVVALFVLILQGVSWMALNRYMQRAHFDANPSIGDAFGRALQRLPLFMAIALALVAAVVVVSAVIGLVYAVVPGIGLLLTFAFLISLVFIWVKLVFVPAAIVASPRPRRALQESFEVSKGRFWPVLGRLLLISIGLWLFGLIVSAVLGDYGSTMDQSSLFDGETFEIQDFAVRDLFPAAGVFFGALIATSIVSTVVQLITTSAFMRLYLDSGAPSDLSELVDERR